MRKGAARAISFHGRSPTPLYPCCHAAMTNGHNICGCTIRPQETPALRAAVTANILNLGYLKYPDFGVQIISSTSESFILSFRTTRLHIAIILHDPITGCDNHHIAIDPHGITSDITFISSGISNRSPQRHASSRFWVGTIAAPPAMEERPPVARPLAFPRKGGQLFDRPAGSRPRRGPTDPRPGAGRYGRNEDCGTMPPPLSPSRALARCAVERR